MNKIAVITSERDQWKKIKKECRETDFLFYWISPQEAPDELEKGKIGLVILDVEEIAPFMKLMKQYEPTREIPVLWVLPRQKMNLFNPDHQVSDVIFSPIDTDELLCRIRRLLCQDQQSNSKQLLQSRGLTIDLVKYEVRLEGNLVNLTYKEYELLKFLASNKGKVFTREVLLNKVWGYDYFGGTRTVDVHVRRLRGKIEDLDHTYVETVRNIGYRFKE